MLRRVPRLLLVLVLAACTSQAPAEREPDGRQKKAALELEQAEQLLPSVYYDAGAAKKVAVLLAHAEPALRSADPRAWAATQLAWGIYWLRVRQPDLAERVRRAQNYFSAAESSLELPADTARLALMYTWLGIAQTQLAESGDDPRSHLQRASEHFSTAHSLWESLDRTADAEAVSFQQRRLGDLWGRLER